MLRQAQHERKIFNDFSTKPVRPEPVEGRGRIFSPHIKKETYNADELLHVLDGEIDLTVLTDEGPVRSNIPAGSVFVVPQGLWHRPVARVMTTLLSRDTKAY